MSAINTLLLLILLNIDSVISGEPVISLVALSKVNSTEIGFNNLSFFVASAKQFSIKLRFELFGKSDYHE